MNFDSSFSQARASHIVVSVFRLRLLCTGTPQRLQQPKQPSLLSYLLFIFAQPP